MLKEYIFKRKSIRSYQDEKLITEVLEKISKEIDNLKPLIKDIKYEVVIDDEITKGIAGIKAPHYLFFYSENKKGYLQNIGFIGQHLSLYLNSIGLGTCWLGMAKPQEKNEEMTFVITMAFGKPQEELFRTKEQFKRKDISKISNVSNDLFEAVRLAPSAINAQDWYFYQDKELIHCYYCKPGLVLRNILGNMSGVDLGIAMFHIYLMTDNFETVEVDNYPTIRDCDYFISVKIK